MLNYIFFRTEREVQLISLFLLLSDVLKEDANDDEVDRCGEACYRFCTKHVDTATNVS